MKKCGKVLGVVLLLALLLSIVNPVRVAAASKPKITLKYKNGATVSVGKTKLGVKASVKSGFSYKTSNKKVAAVKKGVLYAYKPGKVTITITAKPKVSGYSKATKKVTLYVAPKATSITTAQRFDSSIQVTVKTSKYAKGYQFQYAGNSSFKGAAAKKSKNVMAILPISSDGTVYVRVRPYAKAGKKKVYGKWSNTAVIRAEGTFSYENETEEDDESEEDITPTPTPVQTEEIVAKRYNGGTIYLTLKEVPGAAGYVVQYSQYSDMSTSAAETFAVPYCRLSVFSGIYYVRYRSYTKNGDEKVFGAWSRVKMIDDDGNVTDYADQPDLTENEKLPTSPPEAQYSYEAYILNPIGGSAAVLSDYTVVLYLKTDNPDVASEAFVGMQYNWDGKSGRTGLSPYTKYDDIDYTALGNGEYILKITTPSEAGSHILKLWEYTGEYTYLKVEGKAQNSVTGDYYTIGRSTKDAYVVAKEIPFTVLDYDEAYSLWIDNVIAQVTTPTDDSFDKLQDVASYLRSRYDYSFTKASGYANYSWDEVPSWISYISNSYISPSCLCDFAEHIGGFDDIHNCYNDYEQGSGSWISTHYWVMVTIGDRTERVVACPSGNNREIKHYDFSDLSSLHKAGEDVNASEVMRTITTPKA